MQDTIIKSFDIWTAAQGVKSKGRVRSIDNISLEGIAQLRELILELAVRGKLVPQDPNDEPASELVKKIGKEKAKLISEGKLKKEKPLPPISDDEKPFELPFGWTWVRLGEITNKIGSGSTPRGGNNAYVDSGVLFLRSQNIRNEGVVLDDVAYINEETYKKMSGTLVLRNDILLNITGGSLGRCAIFEEENLPANVSQHVTIIRPTITPSSEFLHKSILSPYVQDLIWGRQVGANREGLSKKVLELFEFPLPPLTEQHRIVAKVDELMALCDKLEASQTASLKTHQTLVKALLQTLTDAADADSLAAAWQRLSRHFDVLFCTEDSIEQLKQTILQLAIMGRLVKQDPADEPASELIKRIEAEKAKLIKQGKLKKEKALPQVSKEQELFDLPKGWMWKRLGDVALYSEAGKSLQCDEFPVVDNEWGVIKVSAISWGNFSERENKRYSVAQPLDVSAQIKKGDFIISRANTSDLVGKSVVVTFIQKNLLLSDKTVRFKFSSLVSVDFLNLVNNSLFSRRYYSTAGSGSSPSMKNITRDVMNSLVVALPPLLEQHRIVSKVDELMSLCDSLKARILKAEEVKVQLSKTIVENTKQISV